MPPLACSCVVHYQLPASVDVYVHRSGRTARADAEGISIALVTPKARPLGLTPPLTRALCLPVTPAASASGQKVWAGRAHGEQARQPSCPGVCLGGRPWPLSS